MKIKIYCIIDINGLKYVGSTKKILKQRLWEHRSSKKSNKKSCSVSSKKLDLDNCEIILLCECDECVRNKIEQYFIDNIKCVNTMTYNYNDVLYKRKRNLWIRSWGKYSSKYVADNNMFFISNNVFG